MKLIIALILFLLPLSAFAETSVWDKAAYGSVPGVSYVFLNGNNGGVTTTFEPFWPESAAYTVLTTAMSAPYCASASASDTSAGTGARTVRVTGITSDFAPFAETLTMNGQTSVVLVNTTAQFINSVTVLTAGSGNTNAGVIRCGTGVNSSGVPAVTHAMMSTGFSMTQSGMYGVAANKTLLCRNLSVATSGATANLTLTTAIDTYTNNGILKRQTFAAVNQTASSFVNVPSYFSFPEKTIIVPQVLAATSTGPAYFTAECLLIDLATSNPNQKYF